MLEKIIVFLKQYINNMEETIKAVGKFKTITAGLIALVENKIFTNDELRKELSIYLKRILSEEEFNRLLDYNRIEYEQLLYN